MQNLQGLQKNPTSLIMMGAVALSVVMLGGAVVIAVVKRPASTAAVDQTVKTEAAEPVKQEGPIAIQVEYQESGKLPLIKSLLQRSAVIEYGVNALESGLSVKPFVVQVKECGQEGSAYGNGKAVLCYESLSGDIGRFTAVGMPSESAKQTALYASLFTFLQESAKAVIEQNRIPYTGSLDAASDEMATVFALNQIKTGDRIVKAGILSYLRDDAKPEPGHLSNKDRADFIACRMIGSSPEQYRGLATQIGMMSDRQIGCQKAYQQAVTTWNYFLKEIQK